MRPTLDETLVGVCRIIESEIAPAIDDEALRKKAADLVALLQLLRNRVDGEYAMLSESSDHLRETLAAIRASLAESDCAVPALVDDEVDGADTAVDARPGRSGLNSHLAEYRELLHVHDRLRSWVFEHRNELKPSKFEEITKAQREFATAQNARELALLTRTPTQQP